MGMDLKKKRELVLLVLFSLDAGQEISENFVELLSRECKVAKSYVLEACARAEKVERSIQECDELLKGVCQEYRIERLGSVERSVARLAIFELAIEKELPIEIIVAEAKRVTKKFATEYAARFIHALLAALLVQMHPTTEEIQLSEEDKKVLLEGEGKEE